MTKNSKDLEKTINYKFKDGSFLNEAITHRSYLNENPKWKSPHNERLEFLGDAVLELVVTEELFNRYPDSAEGPLTNLRAALVNYHIMARVGHEIDLEDFILLSKGEAKDSGRARDVILANAMEALIGAIYLDGGYKTAKDFINNFIMEHLAEIVKEGLDKDAKSLLQEKVQQDLQLTPHYKVLKEEGPDHAKIFIVGVYFDGKVIAQGKGYSKQEAELEAAHNALETLSTH